MVSSFSASVYLLSNAPHPLPLPYCLGTVTLPDLNSIQYHCSALFWKISLPGLPGLSGKSFFQDSTSPPYFSTSLATPQSHWAASFPLTLLLLELRVPQDWVFRPPHYHTYSISDPFQSQDLTEPWRLLRLPFATPAWTPDSVANCLCLGHLKSISSFTYLKSNLWHREQTCGHKRGAGGDNWENGIEIYYYIHYYV